MEKRHSYGIIPIVINESDFFVVLVKNISGGHFGFPKGTPEKGESEEQTALRELKEETGIENISIEKDIFFNEYYNFKFNDKEIFKANKYFLALLKNKIPLESKFPDVLECGWFSYSQAKDIITFQESKAVLEQVKFFLKK